MSWSRSARTQAHRSPLLRGGPGAGLVSLAVVAALALVLAILVVRSAHPPEPRATAAAARARLLGFAPSSVRAVEVWRGEHGSSFERRADGWMLRDEEQSPVGDDRIDQFLRTLSELERLDEVADEQANLADFGLAPARGMIVLRGEVETRIAVGDRNPALTALYVQVAPDPHVVMVGAILQWELDKLVGLSTVHHVP